MKKILYFVLILLFAVINFAFAADWVQIAEKVYLDESSLSEYNYRYNYDKDLILSVWEKKLNDGTQHWKDIEKILGKKLWYNNSLFVANCSKKQIAIKSSVYYDLKGNVAHSHENNYLEWHSIVPETVGEYEYMLVCSAVTQQNSNKKNEIITPDGTKIKIKYHKKLFPLNR